MLEKSMHNIRNHVFRLKKQLEEDESYYSELADMKFSFFTAGTGNTINVRCEDDPEFFIETFGMKEDGKDLSLTFNAETEDDYWFLYNNALIVMLEQTLNDPRPIQTHCFSFEYKHSPSNDEDELDTITYDGNTIASEYITEDLNTKTQGTMDEYIDIVKKSWNGTNTAYNKFIYDQVLTFDTYPAY